jgi:hypothetical protein
LRSPLFPLEIKIIISGKINKETETKKRKKKI